MRRLGPLLGVGVLLIAGCGQEVIVDTKAEQTVAGFVAAHTGFRPTSVKCPSGVPAKKGQTFDCHFKGPDGQYVAHVRILSVHGSNVENYIVTQRIS